MAFEYIENLLFTSYTRRVKLKNEEKVIYLKDEIIRESSLKVKYLPFIFRYGDENLRLIIVNSDTFYLGDYEYVGSINKTVLLGYIK